MINKEQIPQKKVKGLSVEQVKHIAKLARIELTEQEKKKFTKEFSAILDYIERLKSCDTSKVEPMAQVTGLENITRQDQAKPQKPEVKCQILEGVPKKKGDYIKVKAVL